MISRYRQTTDPERGYSYEIEYRINTADGAVKYVTKLAEIEKTEAGHTTQYFGISHDIAERKELEQKLQKLSRTDDLTALWNRREFNYQLERALNRITRTKSRIALLCIDLDGFKKVNDELGYDAGDEVLKIVASRLTDQLRKTDVTARIGGDEFTVVLEGVVTRENTILVVEKILSTLNLPCNLSTGQSPQLSGSIGFAIAPDDGDDMKHLISAADTAMYKAKNLGKNRYAMASS